MKTCMKFDIILCYVSSELFGFCEILKTFSKTQVEVVEVDQWTFPSKVQIQTRLTQKVSCFSWNFTEFQFIWSLFQSFDNSAQLQL